ncbi:M16 family metallopeptidase [Paracoccus sp. p4-l81]|uniref:M16 family metallopeptidase n=1 Tax=Paracoccus sp. p4-l81 TaxID=3342806 RepID=UPI0035BA6E3A
MRLLSILVLILLPLRAMAVDIQVLTSPKGQDYWLVTDHSLPFVALQLDFRGGASLDAPGKRGAINLMTALLEEGAGDRDAEAFVAAVEAEGARMSFSAGDDVLSVSAQMLTDRRAASTALLAEALSEPRFDEDAVARVRAQVIQAIRAGQKDPNTLASLAFARQAWGDHPYGTSTMGTEDSVTALTRDDLRAAKDRVITRDHAIVTLVGDIDAQDAGAMIDSLLAGLPATGAPMPPRVAMASGDDLTVIDWDSPQSVVTFGQPGMALDDPDYFPLMIAQQVLSGSGFSARLMDELRDKRGLTYGVAAHLVSRPFGDSWVGGFASANDKTAEAVALLRSEWARMAEGGVTEDELSAAKTYLTGAYPLRFDGNGTIAGLLSGMQLVGLPADYIDRRNDLVNAVTAADVARVASERVRPGDLRIVIAGRPSGLQASPADATCPAQASGAVPLPPCAAE